MAAEFAPPIEYVLPPCAREAAPVHLPRFRSQLVVLGEASPCAVSVDSV